MDKDCVVIDDEDCNSEINADDALATSSAAEATAIKTTRSRPNLYMIANASASEDTVVPQMGL